MVQRLSDDLNQLSAELAGSVYKDEPFPDWDELPVHTQEAYNIWREFRAMHKLWMEYGTEKRR